jgi:hypothetical protein
MSQPFDGRTAHREWRRRLIHHSILALKWSNLPLAFRDFRTPVHNLSIPHSDSLRCHVPHLDGIRFFLKTFRELIKAVRCGITYSIHLECFWASVSIQRCKALLILTMVQLQRMAALSPSNCVDIILSWKRQLPNREYRYTNRSVTLVTAAAVLVEYATQKSKSKVLESTPNHGFTSVW